MYIQIAGGADFMMNEGVIGIPRKDGSSVCVRYQVITYKRKSKYGINGGKISNMILSIGGSAEAIFDKGWKLYPDEENEALQIAYCIVLQEYN